MPCKCMTTACCCTAHTAQCSWLESADRESCSKIQASYMSCSSTRTCSALAGLVLLDCRNLPLRLVRSDLSKSKHCDAAPHFMGYSSQRRHAGPQWASMQQGQGQAVHQGVQCDGCRACPITGPRFCSLDLDNVDMCGACHSRQDASHRWQRLDQPGTSRQGAQDIPCPTAWAGHRWQQLVLDTLVQMAWEERFVLLAEFPCRSPCPASLDL